MLFKIHNWGEIKNEFKKSTLLIGNGASIALDYSFSYNSLKSCAENNNEFDKDVLELFKEFQTDDFELILKLVWHAAIINKKLYVSDQKTRKAYENVRKALINTVRNIHSSYSYIEPHLPYLYEFTKKFKTIISLNYDLILYWIIMFGNNKNDTHIFKDCFTEDGLRFRRNWSSLRVNFRERSNTLVFYPHGNLCLAEDILGKEFKVSGYNYNLLESIMNEWNNERSIPLFVSEGTKEQKKKSIENSAYLNIVFNEVLPKIFAPKIISHEDTENLVIYGWSLGENDEHILKQIIDPIGSPWSKNSINNKHNKMAISLYQPNQLKCFEMMEKIKKILGCDPKFQIYFFDSSDAGCWNNP